MNKKISPTNSKSEKFSSQEHLEIIKDLKRVSKDYQVKTGSVPEDTNRTFYYKYTNFSRSKVEELFGNYTNLKKETFKEAVSKLPSKEDCLKILKKVAIEFEKDTGLASSLVSREYFTNHGFISRDVITKIFGSFSNFRDIGLELKKSKPQEEVSDAKLLKSLRDAAKKYSKELNVHRSAITREYYRAEYNSYERAYSRKYGSFSKFKKFAGLDTDLKKTDVLKDISSVADDFSKEFNKTTWNLPAKYYLLNGKFGNSLGLFGTFEVLKKEALDISSPTRESLREIESHGNFKSKRQTYFVSLVSAGAVLFKEAYESVQMFCKENNAKFIPLVGRGLNIRDTYSEEIKELFLNTGLAKTKFIFNTNLSSQDFNIAPQQIHPLTGLDKYTSKIDTNSIIVASQKQDLKTIPSNITYPHILCSTGTITEPLEESRKRIRIMSSRDRIMGGIAVDIVGEKFFIRQIQFQSDGKFYDLNKLYSGDSVKLKPALALYLGDYHVGHTDPTALKATFEQIDLLKPKEIFIGDFFNGTSINHHEEHDIVAQATIPEEMNSLEKELHLVAKELEKLVTRFPNLKINIVKSNHDAFVDKYIKSNRYSSDRVNVRISRILFGYLLDKLNPIEEWVNDNYPHLKRDTICWFKKVNHDCRISDRNIQCGHHGHKGINGARGNIKSFSKSNGNCIVGHSHSPQIYDHAFQVGTLTHLELDYNEGLSTWLQCNAVIYEDGSKSLLPIIEGKWKS